MSLPTYTQSPPTLWRFQCDPAADGSCVVQAFFRSDLINDLDPTDRVAGSSSSVSFALASGVASAIQIAALAVYNG